MGFFRKIIFSSLIGGAGLLYLTNPSDTVAQEQFRDVFVEDVVLSRTPDDLNAGETALLALCRATPDQCYDAVQLGLRFAFSDLYIAKRVQVSGFGGGMNCLSTRFKMWCTAP
ncbi:hypothetical protein [Cochlodiniinecator piscidefendens]|uniref:hypothetical protein n=1 Tax=Cochlodiniinecator piscidefendens TaxID=2715756 RepID=UPI00140AC7D9|nr:hypothetical protein [Cochlodiniinecator piscidefendens]